MMAKPSGTARKMRPCSEVLPSASEAVEASMAKIPSTETAEVSSSTEVAEIAPAKMPDVATSKVAEVPAEMASSEMTSAEVSSTKVTCSRFGGNGKKEKIQR
jgi:hypothetical protein